MNKVPGPILWISKFQGKVTPDGNNKCRNFYNALQGHKVSSCCRKWKGPVLVFLLLLNTCNSQYLSPFPPFPVMASAFHSGVPYLKDLSVFVRSHSIALA